MIACIYRKDNLDLTYDLNEDTYYISVCGGIVSLIYLFNAVRIPISNCCLLLTL